VSRFGLRGRLAASIAALLVAALGLTFLAVHRGTESELDGRLDDDLRGEMADLDAQLQQSGAQTPEAVLASARAFIGSRPLGGSSQVIAVTVPGAGTATNQAELLGLGAAGEHEGKAEEREEDEHRSEAEEIRSAPPGFSDLEVEGVGDVRLLTSELATYPGGPAAIARVGEPLDSIESALNGLERIFLSVGLVTLGLAVVAGVLLAVRIASPLRRIAGTAEQIDAGDLSGRIEVPRARDEVRSLALAFNGMLDRLQDGFDRQRRFVADASHELRTPLTVIRGQFEVLARSPRIEREDVERVTGLVSDEVGRMERLTDDLLLLARGDRGLVIKPRSVEPAALAREVFESMAVTAERSFEVSRADPGELVCDPDLVSQVVRILTANAISHTAEGGRISLSVLEAEGSWELAIEDDGPGIPEAERDRVFERFYRTDDSRNRSSGGTGLGLAIAKEIAEAHRGSVDAEASEFGGARVSLRLSAA
jgi:signal transduction histidine kinase